MTKEAPGRPRPVWAAEPGARVTSGEAEHGEVRHDANGTQWWYDAQHGGWHPVVVKPEREAEAG